VGVRNSNRLQNNANIWPGFVDALATLLMVIIFLLMIFVLAQFFMGQLLSGRDAQLSQLNTQIDELADLLSLERKDNDNLRTDLSQLSKELQISVTAKDDLKFSVSQLESTVAQLETATALSEDKIKQLGQQIDTANKQNVIDQKTIDQQRSKLSRLAGDISTLMALRKELTKEISQLAAKLKTSDSALASEKKRLLEEKQLSDSARAQVARLNQQMSALRTQISNLSNALDIAAVKSKEQGAEIVSLGKRLNAALASKVQKLSRYRSEFFGRLRDILGNQQGVRIVGDRFVFQSELLFAKGAAELGAKGKQQLSKLATTLLKISTNIPDDIDWVLRVDGHTDTDPIHTSKYPSNWELSSARAISVVKHLIQAGLPANRLVAAGFGEFYPLDKRFDEIAKRRNRRIELKLTGR